MALITGIIWITNCSVGNQFPLSGTSNSFDFFLLVYSNHFSCSGTRNSLDNALGEPMHDFLQAILLAGEAVLKQAVQYMLQQSKQKWHKCSYSLLFGGEVCTIWKKVRFEGKENARLTETGLTVFYLLILSRSALSSPRIAPRGQCWGLLLHTIQADNLVTLSSYTILFWLTAFLLITYLSFRMLRNSSSCARDYLEAPSRLWLVHHSSPWNP